MSRSFDISEYDKASASTLCVGCGHDQVSKHIIKACFEAQVNPSQIAKISGIGCSSKTPQYFLKKSQGFNTIHGRMASVATGVKVANSQLKVIGVSGDGDTGSIGLGSFLHTIRKNVEMVYIIENNGVYGLTKGQLSATIQEESSTKYQEATPFSQLDLCRLALEAGCGFVARSFSGDSKQLVQLLKLALNYPGFALIDVISPCVAYGNEKEFPFSFNSMKANKTPLQTIDIIGEGESIEVDSEEGEVQKIPISNGKHLMLRKLKSKNHNPEDLLEASKILKTYAEKQEIVTGLIYYKKKASFLEKSQTLKKPLVSLKEKDIRLPESLLKKLMDLYR